MQEVVELVVFALIALLVGTGLVWLSGWILGLVGTVLTWFAGLVWSLLRFLVPVAIVAGLVYLLVQFLSRSGEKVARGPQVQPATPPSPWTMSKDPVAGTSDETAGVVEADDAGASDDVAEEPPADAPSEGPDTDESTADAAADASDDERDRQG